MLVVSLLNLGLIKQSYKRQQCKIIFAKCRTLSTLGIYDFTLITYGSDINFEVQNLNSMIRHGYNRARFQYFREY